MKTVWAVISAVSVANVVALLLVTGWLRGTQRVDAARLNRVREIFAEPIPVEERRLAREAAAAKASEEAARLDRVPDGPPLTSSEIVVSRTLASEIDLARIERLRREVRDLRASLAQERAAFERERAAFVQERDRFDGMREAIAEAEGDEQFRKSLSVLQGLKAPDAAETLRSLLAIGEELAVLNYLDAMEERSRTAIFAELVKDGEADLAARLLERLKRRGFGDPAAGGRQRADGGGGG